MIPIVLLVWMSICMLEQYSNSHIHIDISTNTIGHENSDTKTSIHNNTVSNILTNVGELSFAQKVFLGGG